MGASLLFLRSYIFGRVTCVGDRFVLRFFFENKLRLASLKSV